MEIKVNRELRTVEAWLTNDDQNDPELMAWLKEQYPLWRSQKLMPVVYRSGSEDLYENTLALLKYNRRRSAQQELAREQKQRARPSLRG